MNQFSSPFYLGKSKDSDTYFFIANKAGVGRFIKYTKYPFWCAAKDVSDFLSLVDAPQQVVEEVQAFVSGKVLFEVIPKVRGRAERIIRKEVPDISANANLGGVSNVTPCNTKYEESRSGQGSGRSKPIVEASEEVQHSSAKEIEKEGSNIAVAPSEDKRSKRAKGRRGLSASGTVAQSGDVLGLSGTVSGRIGDGITVSEPSSAGNATERGLRRVADHRVLDSRGDGSRLLSRPIASDQEPQSSISGTGTHVVDGPGSESGTGTGAVKQKRKRRTKAEMEAARAAEAANPTVKKGRLSKTKTSQE